MNRKSTIKAFCIWRAFYALHKNLSNLIFVPITCHLAFICCVHRNWMFVINVGASSYWSIHTSSKYSTINLDAYQQPHWIVDLRVFFCYCLLNGCFCFPTALFFDVLRGLGKKTFSLARSCHLSMLYPQAYATIAIYRLKQVEQ